MNLSDHVPEYIRSLAPYVPGKPIEETQREFKIRRVVKLASNENPLGPSPKAISAARKAMTDTHRYPDGAAYSLKQALSKQLKVTPSSLIIGNGSNEIIDFLIRTYCCAGNSIVTSQGAFIAYRICAQIHGVKTIEAPMTSDLCFDLNALLELLKKNDSARMVFVANPNNPTGTFVKHSELQTFLKELQKIRGGTVLAVLDYAYWEYITNSYLLGPKADPVAFMREFPNVVILRTFSKIHGLAGFRVGYGAASSEIIANLEKVRMPFNVNSIALAAAEAALNDHAFVAKARKVNQQGMAYWQEQLDQLNVPYWESQGNFLLLDAKRGLGMSGPEVYNACLRLGAIFRPVANYGMPDYLRISIGTAEENRIGFKALATCVKTAKPAMPALPVLKVARKKKSAK